MGQEISLVHDGRRQVAFVPEIKVDRQTKEEMVVGYKRIIKSLPLISIEGKVTAVSPGRRGVQIAVKLHNGGTVTAHVRS